MKKCVFLLAILTVVNGSAQRFIDDIYFTPKDARQERVQQKGKVKNGAREVIFVNTEEEPLLVPDTLAALTDTATTLTDSMVMEMAEGTYVGGFEGSADDFEYTQRIYRFHNPRIAVQLGDPGYNDIYFLDNDLWNVYIDPYNYAYVTPTWTNPYYWDFMYRPYAYGSWAWRYNPYASWGWNSYWGCNSYFGWDPYWGYAGCWNPYDPFWGYPYWGHHHHHHHWMPHYPSWGHVHDRYPYNQEGERRRREGVRVGTQIDRRASIMGGSAAGNRVSATTVVTNERADNSSRNNVSSNTRRVASTASTSNSRTAISTASRTQSTNRVASTQRRVSTTPRTGTTDVRRSTSSQRTSSGGTYQPSTRTTTSRAGATSTHSTRSTYTPSQSTSRTSSSSYRASSPSRSSSSSSRSSSYSSSSRSSSSSSGSRSGGSRR